MNFIQLARKEIKLDELFELVRAPECGAISFFLGTTRDNFDGLKVKRLIYDAYEGMAFREIDKIISELRRNWPGIANIAIYHRLGEVGVGEPSVGIAISSPHRMESLEGVNYAINALKSRVPVWKKEEYVDSPGVWKVNKECDWTNNSDI